MGKGVGVITVSADPSTAVGSIGGGVCVAVAAGATCVFGTITSVDGRGGVVPGPIGQPRLIVAHSGETILPTHRSSSRPIQVNLTLDGSTLARILVDPLRREAQVYSQRNGKAAFG